MLIWGGQINTNSGLTNTGGRYNVAGDSWTSMSTVNAPPGDIPLMWQSIGSEILLGLRSFNSNFSKYLP